MSKKWLKGGGLVGMWMNDKKERDAKRSARRAQAQAESDAKNAELTAKREAEELAQAEVARRKKYGRRSTLLSSAADNGKTLLGQ